MTEHKFIPINELINRVMMQLKEQHYMESNLIVYKRIYHRIKEFMLQNDYQNYSPDIGSSFLDEQKVSASTMSAYKCAVMTKSLGVIMKMIPLKFATYIKICLKIT